MLQVDCVPITPMWLWVSPHFGSFLSSPQLLIPLLMQLHSWWRQLRWGYIHWGCLSMVVFLHSKIVLLYGCRILTLISMKWHYGCAESCLMHDIRLLHQGVSQGSPEAELLQIAYFLWVFYSAAMDLRRIITVGPISLAYYNTETIIFWILMHYFLDKRGVSYLVSDCVFVP